MPVFGPTAILADEAGSITGGNSPFTKGIVFSVTLALMIPGIVYGVTIGKYKNDKDIWADISHGAFPRWAIMCLCVSLSPSSQISSLYPNWEPSWLSMGLDSFRISVSSGIPLMIGLIILSCFVNLFIGSASAKWAILAPVFIPMMMLMEYDPAVTQVVYRIGDSITNPLSPLFTYMPVILGYARKYDSKAGLGTIIANIAISPLLCSGMDCPG